MSEASNGPGATVDPFLHAEFAEGTKETHLFNGRPLTAEDLRMDRAAVRDRLRRLGRAVGPGVVEGFRVDWGRTGSVTVTEGIALNRRGEALRLSTSAGFPLRLQEEESARHRGFVACEKRGLEGTSAPTGSYLLVASPRSEYAGEVPRVLGGTGGPGGAGCAHQWEVEGVAFELLPLPADAPGNAASDVDPSANPRLRNLLAYWCYRSDPEGEGGFRRSPEGLQRVEGLEDRHVPLAVLHWDGGEGVVLDVWAARRPPGPPVAEPGWRAFLPGGPGRTGLARFLGFQAHLEAIRKTGAASGFAAREGMRYLPPAGLVPLLLPPGVEFGSGDTSDFSPSTEAGGGDSSTPLGFVFETFFRDVAIVLRQGSATLEEARLTVERSFLAEPLDLEGDGALEAHVLDLPGGTDAVRRWVLFHRRVRDLFTVSTPIAEPSLVNAGAVTGTVTVVGEPRAGASVTAHGPETRNVTTGRDGSYRIADLSPGSYRIVVESKIRLAGLFDVPVTGVKSEEVEAGEEAVVNFDLRF